MVSLSLLRRGAANRPGLPVGGPGRFVEDSGDDRLSRQGHYHGPDGLNGRVRNGNGCDPAGMVAGNAPGGRSGRAGGPYNGWSVTLVESTACAIGAILSSRVDPHGRGSSPEALLGMATLLDRSRRLRGARATDRGGQAIGCWDRSAAAVARRTLPAHRPGRLPGAFIACANGNLVLEGASRLDAFSAYPVPTWLPGDAPSGTAGTPAVGPPQSSRTRGDAPQVSYAHGR